MSARKREPMVLRATSRTPHLEKCLRLEDARSHPQDTFIAGSTARREAEVPADERNAASGSQAPCRRLPRAVNRPTPLTVSERRRCSTANPS